MFLNALRFKVYGDAAHRTWKFSQGTGNLANFTCFYETEGTIKDMLAALRYVFGSELNPRILECAAQLTDDNGDTWIVERTPERNRVVKNGKTIENASLGETLLASLLDLDLDVNKTSKIEQAFNFYNLNLNDDELSASLESDHTQPLRKLKGSILENKKRLLDQIARHLDQPLLADDKLCLNILQKCESLFLTYRETLRQRRALLANVQSVNSIDDSMIDQLEKESELIGCIEKTATPLLDPANAPKVLKEKIEKIELELKDHLKDTSFPESLLPIDEIPWDKLASCLSKLEAFERLVQASEKAQTLCSDRVENIQSEYIKTVEELLSSDTQITAELESCLSTLSLQAVTKKEEKSTFGDVIMKFIKPSADVPMEVSESDKHARLENARMAVDFALTRLGELHANLAEARNSFDHLQVNLREHHETIVHEFGKLKMLWQRLSKEHGIPTETNLAELLRLCVRYVKINELFRLKQAYKQTLGERKVLLQKLFDQIIAWRQVSESQKDGSLENPTILLSEAQSIIRYKSAKAQQLEKIKDVREQMKAYQAISSTLNAREAQVKIAWKKCFTELEIPEIAPDRSGWSEFFALAHQLAAWATLASLGSKALEGTQVFSELASDKTFTVYHCNEAATKPSFNLQVARALDKANLRGFVIITTPQKELSDTLIKSGVGFARQIVAQQKHSDMVQKPIASARQDKIQSALDVLNPKRSGIFDKNI